MSAAAFGSSDGRMQTGACLRDHVVERGRPARSVLKIIESPAMPDRSVARRMTLLGREKTRCQRPSKYQIQKNDIEVAEMPAHCSQKLGGSN
jgi:hypothetical protein